MYSTPNNPLTPGSASQFWSPEFEPWRRWRAAGSWVPVHSTGDSLECRAVQRYKQDLYPGGSTRGGKSSSYVAANSEVTPYNGSGAVLPHGGPDHVRAQYASYEMHRDRQQQPAGIPGAFQGQQQFGNIGQAVQAGTWPGMATPPIPSWQPLISALSQRGPGGEPAGGPDPSNPAGGPDPSNSIPDGFFDPVGQRAEDLARFRLQHAIATARKHHPLMTGARTGGDLQRLIPTEAHTPAAAASAAAPALRSQVDSDIYQAFPDPLGNYEQFVRYDEWLRHYRQQLSSWERRVEWERDWHRKRAEVLMHHQAFVFATQQQIGQVPSGQDDLTAAAASLAETPNAIQGARADASVTSQTNVWPISPPDQTASSSDPIQALPQSPEGPVGHLDFATWVKLHQDASWASLQQHQHSTAEATPLQQEHQQHQQQQHLDQEAWQQQQWQAWLPWMQWYQQQQALQADSAAVATPLASCPVSGTAEAALSKIRKIEGAELEVDGALRSSKGDSDRSEGGIAVLEPPEKISTPSSSMRRASEQSEVIVAYPDGYTVPDESNNGEGERSHGGEASGSSAAKLFAAFGRLFGKKGRSEGGVGSDGGGTRQLTHPKPIEGGVAPDEGGMGVAAEGDAPLSSLRMSTSPSAESPAGVPVTPNGDGAPAEDRQPGSGRTKASKWSKIIKAFTGGSEKGDSRSSSKWRNPGVHMCSVQERKLQLVIACEAPKVRAGHRSGWPSHEMPYSFIWLSDSRICSP